MLETDEHEGECAPPEATIVFHMEPDVRDADAGSMSEQS